MKAPTLVPTFDDLLSRRGEILRISSARRARRVYIFGSVARGEGTSGSDIDIRVEMQPESTVLDLSELILDLQEALGHQVDIVELRPDSPRAQQLLAGAVRL